MIDRLYVQNFKCFAEQSVPLGGLTILAGLNGAGKSSVLQALLLLRQSGLHSDGTPGQMRWQGDLVDVGSFSEVLYERAQQDFVVLEARFASKGTIYAKILQTGANGESVSTLRGFDLASASSLYRNQWRMFYLGADRLGPNRAQAGLKDPPDGDSPSFPHLSFGLDVEGQIATLPADVLDPIITKLVVLDGAIRDWRRDGPKLPGLPMIHPESEQTMQRYGAQRVFRSSNGKQATFRLHAMVGGAYRIHVRIDQRRRSLEIGYIGKHLPTARFPT